MRILIVHQVPFRKVHYDRVIDHAAHEVVYLGRTEALLNVPEELRCERVSLGSYVGLPEADTSFADCVAVACKQLDPVDAVVSLSEFGLLAGARARRQFGLPAADDEQVELVRDKVAMKLRLREVGLRVPRFGTGRAELAAQGWVGPTVLKPRDGASSNNVSVHPSLEAAAAALARTDGGYELEEFVAGDVLHIDGSVTDGVLDHPVLSVCVGTPLDFARGRPIASHQLAAEAEVLDFAGAVVAGLRVEAGAIHLEVIRARAELVFLEIGHRVGGAGVLTGYQRRTGIDLAAAEICRQAGLPAPRRQPPSGCYHGFLMCPEPTAQVRQAAQPGSWLREHPYVVAVHAAEPPASAAGVTYQEWQLPLFAEYTSAHDGSLADTLQRHVSYFTGVENV